MNSTPSEILKVDSEPSSIDRLGCWPSKQSASTLCFAAKAMQGDKEKQALAAAHQTLTEACAVAAV